MRLENIVKELDEKWYKGVEIGKDYVEIYKNPSRKDIKEIFKSGMGYGQVRFVANISYKEVFVWDADTPLFHNEVMMEEDIYGLKGVAYYDAGELEVRTHESNVLSDDIIALDVLEGKYDWLENYYFDISIIKEYVEEEEEYLR